MGIDQDLRAAQHRQRSAEASLSYYDDAFNIRWPNPRALSSMQSKLTWVRERVRDAVAQMLAEAEIKL